ncbi:helix-turn-helix domain-containing protein [Mucilaginibacter daejeonensis]|uniref:helix-turn-helix domain-containing protein n=1 Tax=Mucilaginibacter daejeonensis TaxID=398049 RepID=UPI001D175EEC|nr:helix-turn-helix domain-containing protein [Mucilaginibacter daejeonensis]UEG51848.1 helix-turn-helix domain-containing protein [Mucilaginibacter daejeonensis]
MRRSQNSICISRKAKFFVGLVILLVTAALCAAFSMTGDRDFATARREILFRRIGHELLLQSGDSTSRVLPVKKITENEYQIRFENAFTFQTDSLINLTRRELGRDPLASDYVVNVLDSRNPGAAYGYAISKNNEDEIVACKGRKQPKAHYVVDVQFKTAGGSIIKGGYLLSGLPFLAFAGFLFFRSTQSRKPLYRKDTDASTITLGSMLFEAKKGKLVINGITIDLTGTETRVMRIFASCPNEIVERSRLQKEIWEDNGVIVGRSLDVFISKLRKKLEPDPNLKITVLRGKGYRLETNLMQ